MTANQDIHDSLLQRQVYLEKYTTGMQKQITDLLDRSEPAVRDEIVRRLSALSTAAGGYAEFNADTNAKLAALSDAIYNTRSGAINDGFDSLGGDLSSLGGHEAQHLDDIFNKHSPVQLDTVMPSSTLLAAIATSTPFQGRILKDWADSISAADQLRIMDTINSGMALGQSTDSIVRDIFGSGALDGADGVTEITRRNAAAIAQTSIATTANEARAAYTEANSDIIGKEVWVATLDGNTCFECAALDGQEFDVGDGSQPPLHYNCRCVRVPSLNGDVIGDRPYTSATEDQLAGLDEADRAEAVKQLTGTVPASMNYQEWLSTQSSDFQDEVLGPSRGAMFREGTLPLSKFVNRDGDTLTLDELQQRGAASMFISPNVDTNLSLDDAIVGMTTQRQAAIMDANQAINDLLGIEGDQRNVVGAWATGAENSIAMDIPAGTDYETLRAAAAMKGEIANQQAVLVFQEGNGDAAALSKFTLTGNINDIHEALLRDGIENHTLEVLPGGEVKVTVLSMDQKSLDLLNEVGGNYGVQIETALGKGEFIGSSLAGTEATDVAIRADAVNQYEAILKSYVQAQPTAIAAQWDRILADWRSTEAALPGIKGFGQVAADKVVADWIAHSPILTTEQLFAAAPVNDAALKALGKEIAADIPGIEFRAPGIKGLERTLQKMAEGKSAAGITDVVRATFVPETPDQIPKIIAGLAKQFPVVDENWRMTAMGYFDRPVKVLFPNGQIGEVLIAPRELVEAKSDTVGGGHALYKAARVLKAGDPKLAALTRQQQILYGEARDKLSTAWQNVMKGIDTPNTLTVAEVHAQAEAERLSLVSAAAEHIGTEKVIELARGN